MDPLTQTVEVRAFSSDEETNSAMQKKLEVIYADIFISGPVAESRQAQDAAEQQVSKLKKAQASLTRRARELFDEMREATSSLETTLIELHSEARELPEMAKSLNVLASLQAEHRAVSRANSRVLEHLLQQAEIAVFSRTSVHLATQARAVREAASRRIQKTAQMMAEAAEHEGGITFDSMNTLSGEMHRYANELDRQAGNYHKWAYEREEQYVKLAREIESLGSIRST